MKNRKILYLSTHPFKNLGAFSGTNRRIFDALCAVDGYEVAYYQATPNPMLKFFIRSIGYIYRFFTHKSFQTGLEERYFKSICARTLRHLKKNPCDIIVTWQLCFGGAFERYVGKRVFFADSTYHRIVPYYRWIVTDKQFSRVDRSQALLLKNCEQFWCFSSGFVSDAIDYYGIQKKKISLFRFFPTTVGDFSPGIKRSQVLRLLLVGTNYVDKGVPIAINAVYCLNEQYGIQAHLDVVGVNAQGGEDSQFVTFHGRVDQFKDPDAFAAYFSNADIFILPTHHECAGIVFAEAASFGLPSVSYRTGGVPDYVEDDVSGYLLPEGSSPEEFAKLIAEQLGTQEQRNCIGLSARAFYERALSKSVFIKAAKLHLDKLFDKI